MVQEGAAASSEKNVTSGARAPPYKAAEVVASGAMRLVCEKRVPVFFPVKERSGKEESSLLVFV